MKKFKDLQNEKLKNLRKDRFVSDDIHGWALLEYLLEKFKTYLMDDERTENYEQDNQELLKWLSYIAALSQHIVEQLRILPKEDMGDEGQSKEQDLLRELSNLNNYIRGHKKPSINALQKQSSMKWYDVPFSEDQIRDLGVIISTYCINDSSKELLNDR